MSLCCTEAPRADAALATGQNGRGAHWFGISWNKATPADAQRDALSRCHQRGPSCTIRSSFSNTCMAIVFGRLSDRRSGYEWVISGSIGAAESQVLSNCRQRGAVSCELKKSFCDTTPQVYPNPTPPPVVTPPPDRTPPTDRSPACRRYPNLC